MRNSNKHIKTFKRICFEIIAILTIMLASCDVIQKEPLDSIPETEIWNNEGLTNLYLNNLYYLVMPGFSATTNSNLSDETPGGGNLMYGFAVKGDVTFFSSETYSRIRKINILLENLQKSTIPKSSIQQINGQALFLRAWIYWNLVNLYGGVPMIMKVQDAFENGNVREDVKVKRNTTKECVEMITADLDSAYKYLPAKWDAANYGRITRDAALAFKGRILLFWASPQFNPLNKIERWQLAYEVNKSARAVLSIDGYGLNPSFKELFTDCKENTKEAIMVRVYDASVAGSYYHAYDNSVRPGYMGKGGGSSNNSTWNLVQAFPSLNGYPVTTTDTSVTHYNQDRYWLNRDQRLVYTIAYNTCNWPLNGNSSYRLWTYYYTDTKTGAVLKVETPTSSLTGFYCRKLVNPTIKNDVTDKIGTDWMEIRYAEVLLNLAECANEVGKSFEARELLDSLRHRKSGDVNVGMGYIDANVGDQAIMREIIMNERQVELAFENKRYWDLRRRNMFEYDLGPNVKRLNGTRRYGWKVLLNQVGSKTPENMINVRDGLNFDLGIVYNTYFKSGVTDLLDAQYPINYLQPKYNFFAIPQTDIDKNLNLEQTNYWDGAFDPLKE